MPRCQGGREVRAYNCTNTFGQKLKIASTQVQNAKDNNYDSQKRLAGLCPIANNLLQGQINSHIFGEKRQDRLPVPIALYTAQEDAAKKMTFSNPCAPRRSISTSRAQPHPSHKLQPRDRELSLTDGRFCMTWTAVAQATPTHEPAPRVMPLKNTKLVQQVLGQPPPVTQEIEGDQSSTAI